MNEAYVPVSRSEYELLIRRSETLERIESLVANDKEKKDAQANRSLQG